MGDVSGVLRHRGASCYVCARYSVPLMRPDSANVDASEPLYFPIDFPRLHEDTVSR